MSPAARPPEEVRTTMPPQTTPQHSGPQHSGPEQTGPEQTDGGGPGAADQSPADQGDPDQDAARHGSGVRPAAPAPPTKPTERAAALDARILPAQSREDTDAGWGDYRDPHDDDRLLRDRPPHWGNG
jgi:hypothetical protein